MIPGPLEPRPSHAILGMMTSGASGLSGMCHEQVLAAARSITARKGRNEFSPQEVVTYLIAAGTRYRESSIRTHVTSRCCRNATNVEEHFGVTYDYFERVGHARYRIV